MTTAVSTGTYVDPRRAKASVGELAPIWLAGKINLKQPWLAQLSDSGLSGASVCKAQGVLSGLLRAYGTGV